MRKPVIIVPNWNGAESLATCLDSLLAQTEPAHIIVVDNGSADNSLALLEAEYPDVELIRHDRNRGYAGGVNPGFKRAIELGASYAAPFNNDAVAYKRWLEELVKCLEEHANVGIAACKLLNADGTSLDSTGDFYSVWGLPYPRGRGETDLDKYDDRPDIFAASGGASLYRVSMLEQIGLLDEDFFAYYEDVDLSFRAQLAGWKVRYVPTAKAYHQISATSGKIKGFATYHTLKNLPLLLWKNVPWRLMRHIWPRLVIAYSAFALRTLARGQVWILAKGLIIGAVLWPKKLVERRRVHKTRTVSDDYIWSMLLHDLPPNAAALRRLRWRWWKLRGKGNAVS